MPYVQYDGSNNIIGLYANEQDFAPTFLADDDPAVSGYTASKTPPLTLDFLSFLALFTSDEETAVFTARRSDVQVDKFITMAAGATSINLADPRVTAGVNYLVSINLVTSARATAVLAGQAPA